jgi:hypothetical protein
VQRGELRGLAATSPERSALVPDLPTLRELALAAAEITLICNDCERWVKRSTKETSSRGDRSARASVHSERGPTTHRG